MLDLSPGRRGAAGVVVEFFFLVVPVLVAQAVVLLSVLVLVALVPWAPAEEPPPSLVPVDQVDPAVVPVAALETVGETSPCSSGRRHHLSSSSCRVWVS